MSVINNLKIGRNIMAKVKNMVMDQEDLFYSLAEDIIKTSEHSGIASGACVKLATDMNLIEYLGGVDAIEDIVSDGWLEVDKS